MFGRWFEPSEILLLRQVQRFEKKLTGTLETLQDQLTRLVRTVSLQQGAVRTMLISARRLVPTEKLTFVTLLMFGWTMTVRVPVTVRERSTLGLAPGSSLPLKHHRSTRRRPSGALCFEADIKSYF